VPLARGSSRRTIAENIRTERHAGAAPKQAVAIALATARKTAKRTLVARAEVCSKMGGACDVVTLATFRVDRHPWYEVVWQKRGLSRASHRFDTQDFLAARADYDATLRRATRG